MLYPGFWPASFDLCLGNGQSLQLVVCTDILAIALWTFGPLSPTQQSRPVDRLAIDIDYLGGICQPAPASPGRVDIFAIVKLAGYNDQQTQETQLEVR